jgi:hypothetical protein
MVHILKTVYAPVTTFEHISTHVCKKEINLLYVEINLNEEVNIYEKFYLLRYNAMFLCNVEITSIYYTVTSQKIKLFITTAVENLNQ